MWPENPGLDQQYYMPLSPLPYQELEKASSPEYAEIIVDSLGRLLFDEFGLIDEWGVANPKPVGFSLYRGEALHAFFRSNPEALSEWKQDLILRAFRRYSSGDHIVNTWKQAVLQEPGSEVVPTTEVVVQTPVRRRFRSAQKTDSTLSEVQKAAIAAEARYLIPVLANWYVVHYVHAYFELISVISRCAGQMAHKERKFLQQRNLNDIFLSRGRTQPIDALSKRCIGYLFYHKR